MTSQRSVVFAEPIRTAIGTFGGSLKDIEIAKAVVFLASDDASYITGAELFVCGFAVGCDYRAERRRPASAAALSVR